MNLSFARLLVFACAWLGLLTVSFVEAAPPRSLEELLASDGWTWSRNGAKERATIHFLSDGKARLKSDKNPWVGSWKKTGPMNVTVTNEKTSWALVFNRDLVSFSGTNNGNQNPVEGRRMSAPAAPAPAANPAAPAGPAMAITPQVSHFGGMTLAADWMPRKTETRKELLNALEFYANAALGKNGDPRDVVPETLVGPIRWLMPLDEAIRTLPAGAARTAETRITSICFPQNSLSMVGFQTHYFVDEGQRFNLIYLIVDAKRRVVGVELVAQSPKEVLWAPPGPDGERNPYYDFVNLKANGRTGQRVDYQVRPAGRGVKRIKTALYDFKKLAYLENVHWYLAAPFAHSLLDIVELNRRAGMMR